MKSKFHLEREDNKMSDKILIEELFKRLGDNFYDNGKPFYHEGKLCAITDSEAAADALEETLFNLGLDGEYKRINYVNSDGIWECKFIIS